jgi:hypothetical protein
MRSRTIRHRTGNDAGSAHDTLAYSTADHHCNTETEPQNPQELPTPSGWLYRRFWYALADLLHKLISTTLYASLAGYMKLLDHADLAVPVRAVVRGEGDTSSFE